MVEDDAALARSIAALLRAGGHAVDHSASGEEALGLVSAEPYALLILDVGLPDIDGFEVARQLAAANAPIPAVVLISARGGTSYRKRLVDTPALGLNRKSDLTGPALLSLLAGAMGGGRVGADA